MYSHEKNIYIKKNHCQLPVSEQYTLSEVITLHTSQPFIHKISFKCLSGIRAGLIGCQS